MCTFRSILYYGKWYIREVIICRRKNGENRKNKNIKSIIKSDEFSVKEKFELLLTASKVIDEIIEENKTITN